MTEKNTAADTSEFAQELEAKLMDKYGPLIRGEKLAKVLGFQTTTALSYAVLHGKLSIPIFTPENRRGKYALTSDVATWLAKMREQAIVEMKTNANKRE